MLGVLITILFLVVVIYLAYRRLGLFIYTLAFSVLLLAYVLAGNPAQLWKGILTLRWRCCGCSTCGRCASR